MSWLAHRVGAHPGTIEVTSRSAHAELRIDDGERSPEKTTRASSRRRSTLSRSASDASLAQSSAEWQAFREELGLHQSPPFTATCTFRAGEPELVLTIDPRRLNWFSFVWGAQTCDSTRRPVDGLPVDSTGPLVGLPARVHAAMRTVGLKGRRKLQTSGDEATQARLASWLAPPRR
ncbi:MAG: hypothetical protein Q8N26_01390 [Myxococcales bacterium]|nr:hypothetical protein [Myxococcales bacterium]